MIANRSKERAEQLAKAMLPAVQAQVVDWEALQSGSVKADVLANSTSVGMAPKVSGCLNTHPALVVGNEEAPYLGRGWLSPECVLTGAVHPPPPLHHLLLAVP
jgi:hypothetical protein